MYMIKLLLKINDVENVIYINTGFATKFENEYTGKIPKNNQKF